MKKSYLYFLVPVVCTAIFAVFYSHYASLYDAKLAQMAENQRHERDAKLEAEAKAREKAVQEAIVLANKRKAEIAAKKAKAEKEQEHFELAQQQLSKAQEDARRFEEKVTSLKKDVQDNKDQIAKIQQDQKGLQEEQTFLREYVKKAEANAQYLTSVMEKIELADKARAAAEAAAKKNKSS